MNEKKRVESELDLVLNYLNSLKLLVISVVSQKGGPGKSTIVRAMARYASNEGLKVFLMDLDNQQSTADKWYKRRKKKGYGGFCQVGTFNNFRDGLTAMAKGTQLIIVDGPARASKQTIFLAQVSNLVIQPSGPSIDDTEPAVLLFHELVAKGIPKERLLFILNRVSTQSEYKEAFKYFAQTEYNVLNTYIQEMAAYKKAQNRGLSIIETPYDRLNQKATNVVEKIPDYLQNRGKIGGQNERL